MSGEAVLGTCYFYRAGRDLLGHRSLWMCSDHTTAHNDSANVLYTDGAIKRLVAARWRAAGFRSAGDVAGAFQSPPEPAPGMPGPGGPGGAPGMGGGR